MKGVFREYSIGDRLEVRAVLFQLLHRVHRVEQILAARVEALYPDTWEWQVGVVRLSCPALASSQTTQ